MKILQIHNFYREAGGEDQVFAAEYELLRGRGHSVRQYSVRNDALEGMPGIRMAVRTIWNHQTFREIQRLMGDDRPDVVHCHNTFPLISPAVYYAAAAAGVPVVQTLHNYRLLCPGSTFYRDGHVCEECLHSAVPFRAVLHACYRDSRPASACVASMLTVHNAVSTWRSKVHTYIALTEFARTKFLQAGFPAQHIVVKPNFLSNDPGAGSGNGGYALFVGRLAEEKGLRTLLKAWENPGDIPLKVAGTGPLAAFVQQGSARLPHVEYLGPRTRDGIFALMQEAAVLVFPSEWYEGLPMTLIEAFACGTPVVCGAIGAVNELVCDGVNGVRFEAGNAAALSDVIQSLFTNPKRLTAMRHGARKEYEKRYTPEDNYEQLIRIYKTATRSCLDSKLRENQPISSVNTR